MTVKLHYWRFGSPHTSEHDTVAEAAHRAMVDEEASYCYAEKIEDVDGQIIWSRTTRILDASDESEALERLAKGH